MQESVRKEKDALQKTSTSLMNENIKKLTSALAKGTKRKVRNLIAFIIRFQILL